MSWERARLQQASPLHHQESDDDQVAPDIAILAAVPTGLEPATFADHTSAVAIPAVDVDASSQRRADAEAFVAELFPDGVTGKMIAAIGGPPSWDTSTGYDTKKGWREQICDFPADRDAVIDALLAHSDTRDAYLCTGLAYLNRGDGSLKEIWAIHADWDGKPEDTDECLARVEKFGGFAINSGTTGHLQCFIPLREPIVRSGAKQTSPPGTFTWWCEAFHAYLPPGSEKKIWNDILRVPGTFNHKSAVRPGDTGRPTPVTWALRPSGERRDLAELAEQLGLSQAAVAEKPVAGPQEPRTYTNAAGPMESVDLDEHPRVRAALDNSIYKSDGVTVDRSETCFNIVATCFDSPLTITQTEWAVRQHPLVAQRLDAEGHQGDVRRCWDKVVENRQLNRQRQRREQEEMAALIGQKGSGETASGCAAEINGGSAFENAVSERLVKLRIEHEARRRLDESERPPLNMPTVKSLDALLAEPDSTTAYLIEDLAPAGARTLLSAQYKAGKTTLSGNLVRSLVDGDPFLGQFTVHTRKQHVVLIDNELSEDTLRRWLRQQGITNTAGVADVVALRGKVSTFNLLDERCRAEWVKRLRDTGCDYLVLDCLRPVLDSLGLDENRDAGRFLVAFDALLEEAGIPDAMLVQHMGHANERARGDSRLQDWPDAIWRLVRENEEPDSPRYFSAYGRDVDVAEGRIEFDPTTRRFTFAQGTRKQAKAAVEQREALNALTEILAEHYLTPITNESGSVKVMTTNTIKREMSGRFGIGNRRVDAALKAGVDGELLLTEPGPNRSVVYTVASPCELCGKPVADPNSTTHRECEQ